MERVLRIILTIFLFFYTVFGAKLHFSIHELKGEKESNTLLLIGGIHGNEPGSYFAPAILIMHYKIKKGNLIVVPNLNFDSIIANKRGIYGDMNRKFHKISKNDPDYKIVNEIKSLILREDVDFILNLHDGHGFYRKEWQNSIFNPRAWGQSCVIDQKTINTKKFYNLDEIAKKIIKNLNKELIKNHHTFNIKNTETKFKDEEMRLSLTYFAITNNKAAMAIETSKNLEKTYQKIYYQLKAIEEFMRIMDIEFTRDFDLNIENIKTIYKKYYTAVLNDLTPLNLDNIKKVVRFVPMKDKNNFIKAKHPLVALKKRKNYYDLMVGNKKISTLYPDIFPHKKCLNEIKLIADNKELNISIPGYFSAKDSFLIKAPSSIRVNVIGYKKSGVTNENNITIKVNELMKRFSLDKSNKSFRIEFYKDKDYCGMIILNIK